MAMRRNFVSFYLFSLYEENTFEVFFSKKERYTQVSPRKLLKHERKEDQ